MDYDNDPDRAILPWFTTLAVCVVILLIAALIWR